MNIYNKFYIKSWTDITYPFLEVENYSQSGSFLTSQRLTTDSLRPTHCTERKSETIPFPCFPLPQKPFNLVLGQQ